MDFLERASHSQPEWPVLVPALRKIATDLRSYGHAKSRRQAIRIELEMTRLELDASLTWKHFVALAQAETDDINRSLVVKALGLLVVVEPEGISARLSWLTKFARDKGLKTRETILQIFSGLCDNHPDIVTSFVDDLFDLAFRDKPDGSILGYLSNPVFALYERRDQRVAGFPEMLIDGSEDLPTQTCRKICGTFKRLFGMIMQRMSSPNRDRLLQKVPGLNRYLARMIVEGIAVSEPSGLSDKLKAIVENSRTDPEIVSLAGKFIRRELRVSGLDRWPELYELMPKLASRS